MVPVSLYGDVTGTSQPYSGTDNTSNTTRTSVEEAVPRGIAHVYVKISREFSELRPTYLEILHHLAISRRLLDDRA